MAKPSAGVRIKTDSWAMVEATPTKAHPFRFQEATLGTPQPLRAAVLRVPLPLFMPTASLLLPLDTPALSSTTAT